MKRILAATALVVSLTAGAALPAKAAVFPLGVFTTSDTRSFANTVSGTFTDDYTFSLATLASLTNASITNSFSNASQFIKNFTLSLFSGSVGSGTLLATTGAAPVIFSGFEAAGLEKSNVAIGDYYLEVTGTTGKASYGGSLSVSAVPLPTSVALFGAALAGLGVVGAVRRKSRAARTAA